ncbi:LysR family transcriptional regulator [Pigmentiphaga aceris]|uniref:LysR family transcriptional regulator n=1 Tax=Pigmentiphaga aceris TaxID=1940612 RepID=A0A5C0AVW1_9BURK|nr:LysR family transcriptional regulator [Pigmentiphaga aceris]QEI06582.1 LysR family transcriptional regulator [Pigmentiphaga aceris]
MDRFMEMKTFIAVVDAGSFIGAADPMGMSKAAVSRHVSDLENRLGVRLLQRTTRRLSLTDEGQSFYARSKEALALVDEAETEIRSRSIEASGVVRVNAPHTFGVLHLAPLWGGFMDANPRVSLEVTLSDRVVDLVDEGFDLAIRIAVLPNSTLVSRKLASTRMMLCASPDYLARVGTPSHPKDLALHQVIAYSYWATRDEWTFTGPEGEVSVRTHARLYANNGDTCLAAALSGQGIILQPSFLVAEDVRAGRLVELMPEYKSIELGIYAVYPTRKQLALKVRRLIDFLADALQRPVWMT